MPTAIAWIMTLSGDLPAAVGAHEFAHVLPDTPARTRVPGTPDFMNETIPWDGQAVPVFDAARFSKRHDPKAAAGYYYGIVRYRPAPSSPPVFGAVKMSALPMRMEVDDESACELAAELERWRSFTVSCFSHNGRPVPVLDLASLFAAAVSEFDRQSVLEPRAGAPGQGLPARG